MLWNKYNVALTSITKLCFQVFALICRFFLNYITKIEFSLDNWLTFTKMTSNRSVILIFSCFDVDDTAFSTQKVIRIRSYSYFFLNFPNDIKKSVIKGWRIATSNLVINLGFIFVSLFTWGDFSLVETRSNKKNRIDSLSLEWPEGQFTSDHSKLPGYNKGC